MAIVFHFEVIMSDIINLTKQERDRFAAWLIQEADNNDVLTEQMAKLPHTAPVVSKYRAEALAFRVVAKVLNGIEDMTIG